MDASYIPHTGADRAAMLAKVGAPSVDDLFSPIPERLRLKAPLHLPPALTEMELAAEMARLAGRNASAPALDSYLGAGVYERYIPSVVSHLAGRSEFYTAYTPYQAEMTQGMLQAIYEYQSMVCLLTGMDVANASLWEGGHALAEACLMASGQTGRKQVVLGFGVHPEYRQVLATYVRHHGIEVLEAPQAADGATDLALLEAMVGPATAAVVCANPNFFGCVEQGREFARIAHAKGALAVAVVEPVSLALLAAPGEYDADIACGEGQPLGVPASFGGPYLGFIACKSALVRRMPGRLVGATTDNRGQRGYVLTLQTREQHIRREKATSNICSNEALMALRATIHLSALGPKGLEEVADRSLQNAHYLAGRLASLPGASLPHKAPFFCEFTLRLPVDAEGVCEAMLERGILAGVPLSRFWPERPRDLLVAVTETKDKARLDRYADALKACLEGRAA